IPSFKAVSGNRSISCLYFSPRGTLWAGTTNGLIEYKPQTDSVIFNPIEVGNDIVLVSITEDYDGNIWGATAGAVVKYTPHTRNLEFFPLDKDLPLKSFFDGCAAISSSGDILFGGDNGYISIPPSSKPNFFKPRVYVTSLEINSKRILPLEPGND